MKNEHEQDNVCRGSLECSAFQFQLITQFIFQKVKTQRGIYSVNNRANEKQSQNPSSNYFHPPLLSFSVLFFYICGSRRPETDAGVRPAHTVQEEPSVLHLIESALVRHHPARDTISNNMGGQQQIHCLTRTEAVLCFNTTHSELQLSKHVSKRKKKTSRIHLKNLLNKKLRVQELDTLLVEKLQAEPPGRSAKRRSFFLITLPLFLKHCHCYFYQ